MLSAEQRRLLEEHLALFDRVAANALWLKLPQHSAWHFKNAHFDFTLGGGLSFLKTDYGVDGGLFVLGEDVVSSAERKMTALVGAAFGIVVPLGHSFLAVRLVDFASSNTCWRKSRPWTSTNPISSPPIRGWRNVSTASRNWSESTRRRTDIGVPRSIGPGSAHCA